MVIRVPPKQLLQRIQKEIQDCQEDETCGFTIKLSEDHPDYSRFQASFSGPKGTPYEEGIFEMEILCPENWPAQPLEATLITPVYHPNISSECGAISTEFLDEDGWSPVYTIRTVLLSIQALLGSPFELENPERVLNKEAANQYATDRDAFEQQAREWTQIYAQSLSEAGDKRHGTT